MIINHYSFSCIRLSKSVGVKVYDCKEFAFTKAILVLKEREDSRPHVRQDMILCGTQFEKN